MNTCPRCGASYDPSVAPPVTSYSWDTGTADGTEYWRGQLCLSCWDGDVRRAKRGPWVYCGYCGAELPRYRLARHEDNCSFRPRGEIPRPMY